MYSNVNNSITPHTIVQVTMVKDNIMPTLARLSHVEDLGVRMDVSHAYASISSNAQCQVKLANEPQRRMPPFC